MEEAPARLDALSEMMALSSYGNTKNILVTAVETKGLLDEEAVVLDGPGRLLGAAAGESAQYQQGGGEEETEGQSHEDIPANSK